MDKIIKSKGELYQYSDGGVIAGYTKLQVPEKDPFTEWRGRKMPHLWWQKILQFFIWTCAESKGTNNSPDEALVHLFYNEGAGEWMAWAPPQRGAGMTVKTVEEHPNWKQSEEFVGFVKVGTGHHHCWASAFQSGTDHADEATGNGLHFTVGHLDKNILDLHGRAVYNGSMISFEEGAVGGLSSWVEMADRYSALNLPSELHYAASYYSFKSRPGPDITFPESWKANYLKWNWDNKQSAGFTAGNGVYVPKQPPAGYSQKDGYWSTVNGVDHWVPFGGARHQPEGGGVKLKGLNAADKAELELGNLLENRNYTLVEMQLICEEMNKLPRKERDKGYRMREVNEILTRHGCNTRWLEKWIEDTTQFQLSESNAWRGGA